MTEPKKTLGAIITRDRDTIETVQAFRDRKDYGTASEALEKLINRAKEYGLHVSDTPLMPARFPIVGTVTPSGEVTS